MLNRKKEALFEWKKALKYETNKSIIKRIFPPKNVIKRNTILINQRLALSFLISGNLELAY